MPTRRPDPARERRWRRLLSEWTFSGLKAREFCAWAGVTPTAFAHWRKEIAARDARTTATVESPFVPVHVVPAPAAASTLDVTLPGGRVVRVPRGFYPGHLRAGVTALEAPS